MRHTSHDHITPYDRFAWTDEEAERLLLSGKGHHELAAFFGEAEYHDLVKLAREAHRVALSKNAPRVFVVPGIMGSQLGRRRRAPHPHDIVWLDPVDIEVGKLPLMALPTGPSGSTRGRNVTGGRIVPLGAVLYSHLRLKLHLRARGFAPVLCDYDWRLDIDQLGRALARRLRSEPAKRIMIVAHSMGGLVSRAALRLKGGERVERVVLLGTPNFGSYAPVQALRGTYAVVRKIARLDQQRSAESLAADVFNTFPSLYQMLPVALETRDIDLFDPAQWPRSGPRPRPELLEHAQHFLQTRARPADERFAVIVGVNQETVTGLTRRKDEFIYTITLRGDGTVPANRAVLPGARTYFAPVAHSELTRDPVIARAIVDLLDTGSTRRLTTEWPEMSPAQARIGDRALRRTHIGKVQWAGLEPEERRIFLQTLNEPPKFELHAPSHARRSQ